jgi:hypothetical protein
MYRGVDVYIHIFLTSALDGVVSFTPRPFYPWGNSLRYSLDRRLGGRQNRSGRRGKENLAPIGTRVPTPRPLGQ